MCLRKNAMFSQVTASIGILSSQKVLQNSPKRQKAGTWLSCGWMNQQYFKDVNKILENGTKKLCPWVKTKQIWQPRRFLQLDRQSCTGHISEIVWMMNVTNLEVFLGPKKKKKWCPRTSLCGRWSNYSTTSSTAVCQVAFASNILFDPPPKKKGEKNH